MVKKIGAMIKQMRLEAGVLQKVLGDGLISASLLSRIENGEAELDSFLVSALIQRLGKSMDRFEMTVSNDEYTMILLQAFLQESLSCGDFEKALVQIDEYEKTYLGMRSRRQKIHKQYVKLMRGIVAYLQTGERAAFSSCLEKTLLITCPKWKDGNWNIFYLCEQEMQIIMLMAYMKLICDENDEAIALLVQLKEYIEERITAEKLKVRVVAKCYYLLATAYVKVGAKEEAWNVSGSALECLTENGIISFVLELLELRQECKRCELEEKQIEAIKFLYEYIEYENSENLFMKLLISGEPKEVILSNELLREEREMKKVSQAALAEGICARETISLIESGRTAHRRNMKELLNRLGVERDIYYGSVVADDYETYEKIREYKKNMCYGNRSERSKHLAEIAERIDNSLPVNKQFLEANSLIYGDLDKEIGYEKVIEKLIECLKYTMPEFDGKIYRIPSKEEFIILNNIALRLGRNNRRLEALILYRKILERYKKSKVALEHHSYQVMLLYLEYATVLEESGFVKISVRIAKEGLRLVMKNQRGDVAGMIMANLSCAFEKMDDVRKNVMTEKCSRHGYYLLGLFQCESDYKIVKEYYETKYSKTLLE